MVINIITARKGRWHKRDESQIFSNLAEGQMEGRKGEDTRKKGKMA